jgi:hypothetical protein
MSTAQRDHADGDDRAPGPRPRLHRLTRRRSEERPATPQALDPEVRYLESGPKSSPHC